MSFFSERLEALKVLSSKKIEQIEKNRKEYDQLYFYTNKLMFGPITSECEKVLEPYPFKSKRAIPYQNKTKSCDKGHVYIEYFDS